MRNILSVNANARVRPNDIFAKAHKSASFGDNASQYWDLKSGMLYHKTKTETYHKFKQYIVTSLQVLCKRNVISNSTK